jgi:pimeloyl-ACP methyl ester carboxylesterase
LNNRVNHLPLSQLIVVPNAGHQMMIDNPDGFHNAIEQAFENHED